jgi:ATP-dependent exoDNAse (exonuclease V) alpha subunit
MGTFNSQLPSVGPGQVLADIIASASVPVVRLRSIPTGCTEPDHHRQPSIPPVTEKVERFGWIFAPGDKVMQIENDYDKEVYNGNIGRHRRCGPRCPRADLCAALLKRHTMME